MKRIFTFLAGAVLAVSMFAQSPEKISYQAVIRNTSDQLITEQSIGIQVSILKEATDGIPVYVETHSATTNINGLVTIEIGTGTTSDDFSSIDWGNGTYFIKTETDPTTAGGTNYTITGISQLLSVPYALYSKSAETITGEIEYTETDPVYATSEAVNIKATDISNLGNLSGINTGDQDLSAYATKDMGNENITNLADPVNDQDAATKAYVNVLLDQIQQLSADLGVTDIDGNHYDAVKVGTQIWMKENLKSTKYQNGDEIGTTTPPTLDISGEIEPKYQWANLGDENNVEQYGRQYTWYAAKDSRNVCPEGWRVPSDEDWTILSNYLADNGYGFEGSGNIAKSLAAKTNWSLNEYLGTPGNHQESNNSSNFSALPGGGRGGNGVFDYFGSQGLWWSSSEISQEFGSNRIIYANQKFLHRGNNIPKNNGFSVRCIKSTSSDQSTIENGLFSIKTGIDELYFIEMQTGKMTKIANLGLVVDNTFLGMQFKNNILYISYQTKLYSFDLITQVLTEILTNSNLSWQFSFNSTGDLYTLLEVSGPPQGSLYSIDTSSNTSSLIGTTGTLSIWGLGFDSSDQLWAVEEFDQTYGTMNTATGIYTATSSRLEYTDPNNLCHDHNGFIYSIQPSTGIVRYNKSTDIADLFLPLENSWAGLAFGSYQVK